MRERNSEGKFTHQTFEDRICVACDSKTTYIDRTGRHQWRMYDDHWYCKNCYCRYVDNPIRNPITSKKWNPIRHARYGPRRYTFKDKRVQTKEIPRTGTCQKCGKKIGDEYINCWGETAIIKRTHIHHIQYDENNPFGSTIELCVSCHMKEPRINSKNKKEM